MKTYFLTPNGAGFDGSGYTPDGTLPAGAIVCTKEQADNFRAYALSNGAIVAAAPAVIAAQQFADDVAALASGTVAITSTSTPALDGSYTITAQDQQHIAVEVQSLMLNGTFADGTASLAWPDATGVVHTFDAAQFKAFATAIGAFVAACIKCSIGTSTTLPSASLTIA